MTLDVEMRALAKEMFDEFGKVCIFNSFPVNPTYDPETGLAANTSTPYSIKLYLDSPNSEDLRGGQVIAGDSVAIFAASGLAVKPQINDTIVVDAQPRVVKMVSAVWSGELVALWRVFLAS